MSSGTFGKNLQWALDDYLTLIIGGKGKMKENDNIFFCNQDW